MKGTTVTKKGNGFYPSCTAYLFQPEADVKEGVAGICNRCVRCSYPQVSTVHQHVQISLTVQPHPDTTALSDVFQYKEWRLCRAQIHRYLKKYIRIIYQEEDKPYDLLGALSLERETRTYSDNK